MNNLYVVESPLQALCAVEISLAKKNESHKIIIMLSNSSRQKNNQQIMKIIELRDWHERTILKPLKYKSSILAHINNLKKLSTIRKKYKSNIQSLYIGDFRYPFMNMVRCAVDSENVTLIDDGTVTIEIIRDYIKLNKYHPDIEALLPRKWIKRLIYKRIYNNYLDKNILKKRINVLTSFHKKSVEYNIDELKFTHIKKLIGQAISIDDNLVYFYGSKYSEAGVMPLEDEIELIKSIQNFYQSKKKSIIYFPHRDDSKQKLNILKNTLKLKISDNSDTAELGLLHSKILPAEVCGAFTSTLNNVKVIFPEITVCSFKPDLNKINPEHRNEISDVYKYYEDLGIEIYNL